MKLLGHHQRRAIRLYCYVHSLSLSLIAGYLLTVVILACLKPGTYWYDRAATMEGAFAGGWILAIFGRRFWERGSDPTKRPEEKSEVHIDNIENIDIHPPADHHDPR